MFKNLCKLLKIEKLQTTAYRPQSNGSLERSHKDLAAYLRNVLQDGSYEWDEWLRQAAYVHNTHVHAANKYSPFECLFGFTNKLPTNLMGKVDPVYNADDYCIELRYKMQRMHVAVRANILEAKNMSKKYYDKTVHKSKIFSIGDKVFLKKEGRKGKLDEVWSGPFDVLETKGVNTTIKNDGKTMVVHNNRLKLCHN